VIPACSKRWARNGGKLISVNVDIALLVWINFLGLQIGRLDDQDSHLTDGQF
jgi:hypothetical protein